METIDYFSQTLGGVSFIPPTLAVCIAALLAVALLLFSGYASASEIAFFNLSPSDLNALDPEHRKTDQQIETLRQDSERTLATILITNNLVNVTIIMLCNYVFDRIVDFGNATWLRFICITVILTFLLLLFGEIMPKIYGRQNSLKYCRFAVGGLMVLRKLFWPMETVLMSTGTFAEKIVQKENHVLSVDDLEQALELTDKEEIKNEQSMLQGIIRFGDETVKEIMTPRQDIVDLNIKDDFNTVINSVVENNYSRIPIPRKWRQYPWRAVYQGPSALYRETGFFQMAEPDTAALFRARDKENRRPLEGISGKQDTYRHCGR